MDNIKDIQPVGEFTIIDYISFGAMIIICSAIGIYYGFFKDKMTVTEYIVGSRNMKILPVALSMLAGIFSSSLYVGKITEVYFYGIGALLTIVFSPISAAIFILFYLPTLHELQLTTLYEYLHLRFGNSMRLQTAAMFIIQQIFICPVIIYVAAICFNEVSGMSIYLIALITSIICILYTCVGGLKAVIWTDVIQTVVMIIAILWIAIAGTISIGNFQTVWERNYNSSRLDMPSLGLNFSDRYSTWGLMFGYSTSILVMGCLNQGIVQRCLCLPTLRDASWAVIINFIGIFFIYLTISYSGYVIYAAYYDCDPLTAQILKRKDQIVAYYVMNSLKSVIGIKGMFIAGIFSAALSTLSTSLNGLACVLLQDFYKPFVRKSASETEYKIFMMMTTLISGMVFMALVFVVEKMGSVFQVTVSMLSIVNGPLLAMFTVGLYMPSVRSKAALAGYWTGFLVLLWIFIGSILTVSDTNVGIKPLNTFGCENFNETMGQYYSDNPPLNSFSIYKISFLWYTLLGFIVSIIVTCIFNLFMEKNDVKTMDQKLLSPWIRRVLLARLDEDLAAHMNLLSTYNNHTLKIA